MFAMIWPFDWSCSGLAFTAVLLLVWTLYSVGHAASKAVDVAKKVAGDEGVREAGGSILGAWLRSKLGG